MEKELSLPDELLRLNIKEQAEAVRVKFAKQGLADIFDILSETALLIRKPLDTKDLSGFITFYKGRFVVYLNSSFTLGHERYTGAHELYHIIFNEDLLKKEKVFLDKGKFKDEELKAEIFAAEFLMPEDNVKRIFYKNLGRKKDFLEERHIIRLHNHFKVSYKAMLKRLVQLKLCSKKDYFNLIKIASLERMEDLQSLTREEGYNVGLITPSNENYIPEKYLTYARANVEDGKTPLQMLRFHQTI